MGCRVRCASPSRSRGSLCRCAAAFKQFFEVPLLEIEMVLRPNNPDPQMAQRELSPFLDLISVVETDRLVAVDEGDAAGADDFADVSADNERGVFVDAKA